MPNKYRHAQRLHYCSKSKNLRWIDSNLSRKLGCPRTSSWCRWLSHSSGMIWIPQRFQTNSLRNYHRNFQKNIYGNGDHRCRLLLSRTLLRCLWILSFLAWSDCFFNKILGHGRGLGFLLELGFEGWQMLTFLNRYYLSSFQIFIELCLLKSDLQSLSRKMLHRNKHFEHLITQNHLIYLIKTLFQCYYQLNKRIHLSKLNCYLPNLLDQLYSLLFHLKVKIWHLSQPNYSFKIYFC